MLALFLCVRSLCSNYRVKITLHEDEYVFTGKDCFGKVTKMRSLSFIEVEEFCVEKNLDDFIGENDG